MYFVDAISPHFPHAKSSIELTGLAEYQLNKMPSRRPSSDGNGIRGGYSTQSSSSGLASGMADAASTFSPGATDRPSEQID